MKNDNNANEAAEKKTTLKKNIDVEKVKAYLYEHHSITDDEARQYIGTSRLGARIWDLRHEQDIDIVSFNIPVERVPGRISRVTQYRLWDDVAKEITPEGVMKELERKGYKKVAEMKSNNVFVRYVRIVRSENGRSTRYNISVPIDPTNLVYKTSLRFCVNSMMTDPRFGGSEGSVLTSLIAASLPTPEI